MLNIGVGSTSNKTNLEHLVKGWIVVGLLYTEHSSTHVNTSTKSETKLNETGKTTRRLFHHARSHSTSHYYY